MKAARIEQQQTKQQPGEQHWYHNCHPELDVKVLYAAVGVFDVPIQRMVTCGGRYIYGSEWIGTTAAINADSERGP